MSRASDRHDPDRELLSLHAVGALPASEAASVEAHAAGCQACRDELLSLRSLVGTFVAWPTDVLRPAPGLWDRLADRIATETGRRPAAAPAAAGPAEGAWEQPAPGIEYKLLATDPENQRVSMLVRLAPGAEYPPHRHAGTEELWLLHGELVIDDRMLFPGDYHRAERGSTDRRVQSRTGCTCLLLTSLHDELGAG